MNANHNHFDGDFGELASRLIAACPVELPQAPAPAPDRRAWLADRCELLRAGGFSARAIDDVRADRLAITEALRHATAYRDTPGGARKSILVLLGGVGCGKTTAAAWLASEVGGSRPGLVRAGQLERAGRYDRDLDAWVMERTLLVIDDLGVEYQDSRGAFLSVLDDLVDAAYGNRRRLVVTSNLDHQGLADRLGERIWSRFCDGAQIVHCGAADLRSAR